MLCDDYALSIGIILGAASTSQHLQNVLRAQLHPASLFRGINLGALDNDSVCRQVDAPSKSGCADQDLHSTLGKQILNGCAVWPSHTCMVYGESVRQEILEITVGNTFGLFLENFSARCITSQDLTNRLQFKSFVSDVLCSFGSFFPRVHEDQ